MSNKPTLEFYGFFQQAYDHFNVSLFDGTLPACMITAQRHKAVMGYFIQNRWVKQDGRKTHEIALNPTYFASYPVLELFQTLVHEMVHLWQHEFGKPGRGGYHNKQWADKMVAVGLRPISQDQPGKGTGQKVSDEAIPEGVFFRSARKFIATHVDELWFDRFPAKSKHLMVPANAEPDSDVVENILETVVAELLKDDVVKPTQAAQPSVAEKKRKVKFTCPGCQDNAWGKATLQLVCGKCEEVLVTQ